MMKMMEQLYNPLTTYLGQFNDLKVSCTVIILSYLLTERVFSVMEKSGKLC